MIHNLFAGVRNSRQCLVLSKPRGFPEDILEESLLYLLPEISQITGSCCAWFEPEYLDGPETVCEIIKQEQADRYGYSWLKAAEIMDFNYDQTFTYQRRDAREYLSYRDILGVVYFRHLEALRALST